LTGKLNGAGFLKETNNKMGYFRNWANCEEWAYKNGYEATCEFCGDKMIYSSPNKKYCSWEENAPCAYERWSSGLSLRGWINKVCGMTVKEFIADQGIDVYNSLKEERKNNNHIELHQHGYSL